MDELILAVVAASVVIVVIIIAKRKFRRTVVYEWDWGIHYRNGKFQRVLPTGAYRWFLPGNEILKLDNRLQIEAIPGQEVLTQDNAGIKLSIIAEYRIVDPALATREAKDITVYLHTTAQVAIRDAVGKRGLDEILSDRGKVADEVHETTISAMVPLGVEVTKVYLRDIMLGRELRSGYAAVLAARKDGEAALERARGETAALRSLANAAHMIKDNPDLVQLRLLQAMSSDQGGKRTFVIGMPSAAASSVNDIADND